MHVPSGSEEEEDETVMPKRKRMLLDAFAGAAAGCISRVIVAPLDLVKIRLQVQLEPVVGASSVSKYTGFTHAIATVFREEGVMGLWRGTVPGLLLTVPYTAVQFVALQQVKEAAAKMGFNERGSGWSSLVSLGSGAAAGAAATVASYPFDLLRTTLAAQGEPKVYHSMTDAARGIFRENGVTGLYRGLGVTLVEIVPYAALQFGLYDALSNAWTNARIAADEAAGKRWRDGERPPQDKMQAFACGLLAGLVAKLASHPLDVAKKRYQVAGLARSLRYGARVENRLAARPLLSCLAEIYAKEGLPGLWKGSVPSVIKAAPAAALTFTAYEAIVAWMLAASARSKAAGDAEQAPPPPQQQQQKKKHGK